MGTGSGDSTPSHRQRRRLLPLTSWLRLHTITRFRPSRARSQRRVRRKRVVPGYAYSFRAFVLLIVRSQAFSGTVLALIGCNVVLLALDADYGQGAWSVVFDLLDTAFLALYTVEALLKAYADPLGYWQRGLDRFDLFVLLTAYVRRVLMLTTPEQLTLLRVLGALRSLRAARFISFSRQLQVITAALLKTVLSVVNLVLLLLLVMFVFAIVGYYFFGSGDDADETRWGTLGRALFSLFVWVTADGWTVIQGRLDERGHESSRIFSVVFLFTCHFIFINLFISVVVQNLEEATDEENAHRDRIRRAMNAEKRAQTVAEQEQELQRLLDNSKGVQSTEDVQGMLSKMAGQLRHDELVATDDLAMTVEWLEAYTSTLHEHEVTVKHLNALECELLQTIASIVAERRVRAQRLEYDIA